MGTTFESRSFIVYLLKRISICKDKLMRIEDYTLAEHLSADVGLDEADGLPRGDRQPDCERQRQTAPPQAEQIHRRWRTGWSQLDLAGK